MSKLWLPAEVEGQLEAGRVAEFSARLRAFDERMECILATEDSEDGTLLAGWYYLVRHNEDGTIATWQVHDMGKWREPAEIDIEALRKLDLRNPRVQRERKEQAERKRREAKAEARRAKEDREAEIYDRLTYLTRTQVPFNHSVRPGKKAA